MLAQLRGQNTGGAHGAPAAASPDGQQSQVSRSHTETYAH